MKIGTVITLLSISDQDSAYEKMGKHISQADAEYLNNDSEFSFPICHIREVLKRDSRFMTHTIHTIHRSKVSFRNADGLQVCSAWQTVHNLCKTTRPDISWKGTVCLLFVFIHKP